MRVEIKFTTNLASSHREKPPPIWQCPGRWLTAQGLAHLSCMHARFLSHRRRRRLLTIHWPTRWQKHNFFVPFISWPTFSVLHPPLCLECNNGSKFIISLQSTVAGYCRFSAMFTGPCTPSWSDALVTIMVIHVVCIQWVSCNPQFNSRHPKMNTLYLTKHYTALTAHKIYYFASHCISNVRKITKIYIYKISFLVNTRTCGLALIAWRHTACGLHTVYHTLITLA